MKQVTSVFWYALAGCLALVAWGSFAPKQLEKVTSGLTTFISERFGWYYLLLVTAIVVFCVYLIFSRFGKIKLGKKGEKPEFSLSSWFAMLFSAGMGIGVVFWSTAEPITYAFKSAPTAELGTDQAIDDALKYTFLHWGISAWAIYAIVGMVLAYFKFHKGYPGLISATLIPLLGEDLMKGWLGKIIDVLAVFATVVGVAAALGFGSAQITGGFNFLFNTPQTFAVQLLVLTITTVLFIISAWSGVGKGIKYLSNINMGIGFILFVMLFVIGPTMYILNMFTNTLGNYIADFVQMSFRLAPQNAEERTWINNWTLFYWAFWISWSPFVGTFIARISRGRTVKEFMMGVLFVPAFVCFIFFSIFGVSALNVEGNGLAELSKLNLETMTFGMLEQYPLGTVMSILTILVVSIFFITSADSATFVLGMLTTNGLVNPANTVKVIWGLTQAAVAAIVVYFGGTQGLQNTVIISALPFSIIIIMMSLSFLKAVKIELKSSKIK
ncbi:BCCT family transporter [Virgibacillus halodenitrificans]|uniref:BCCT family transporter n=1 Tax=Virgibacillus halodenitrificans TaxID=1482 RepID=A0ABR7VIK7_VIRHA|nr:BCCT family transporter [Virgibacillus halodenitrificans]MBD1221075.1 BCCT family transporter [Virgibacillus halodenitrificans]MCG1030125.1 BCCT family transporter [Virgibacillus halodenitrificans]MYL46484.1 BCCT family transporter [Virgibacillus halodenitrificans]MYL58917.1 BCCT family transporter [Virgibacillus halodenitrificans]